MAYQASGLVKPSVRFSLEALDRGAAAGRGIHPIDVAADELP